MATKKSTKKAAKKAPAKKAAAKEAPKKKAPAKKAAKKKVEAVPAMYGTATPYLVVSPCIEALAAYEKALGAKVLSTMPGPDGKIMHAELKVGDSVIMLSDEMEPPPGHSPRKTPKNAGTSTGGVMLYVKDVDKAYQRAVDAGFTGTTPPTDMFWGDRYSQLEDPFGHFWSIATHIQDMTPKQMQAAMMAMMAPPPAEGAS